MADHQKLAAQPRDILGKKVKQLRRSGLLPGIVYGPAVTTTRPVMIDAHAFEQVFRHAGTTALVDLALDGDTHTVFIRDVQVDPVWKSVLHIDFYAPNLSQPMVASVPIVMVGELAPTVDGVLTRGLQDIEVRALPENVPHQVEADISGLDEVNSTLFVSDLVLPSNAELVTPATEIVVQLTPPQFVEEAVAPPVQEVLAEETGDVPSEIDEGAKPVEEEQG